jgi:hypothetical protein
MELLDDEAPSTTRRRSSSGAGHALRADANLAFAAPLLDRSVASDALRTRMQPGSGREVRVSRAELLRHKPGRRCLLGFEITRGAGTPGGTWLGKVRAKGTNVRAAAMHQSLWDSGLRCIAEPLGVIPAFQMTLQRMVHGISCAEALGADAEWDALGSGIADSLIRLHRAPVSTGRTWNVDDEMETLRDRLLALRERQPQHHLAVTKLQRRLMEIAEPLHQRSTRAIVHRDFYHDQVLVAAGTCCVVDLDLVADGDPALDVGNFVGHLVELAWRGVVQAERAMQLAGSFVQAYQALAPGCMPESTIVRYAYLTLGRLVEIAAHHEDRLPFVPVLLFNLQERLSSGARSLTLEHLTDHPCIAL